jgi:hypothetical protein
MAKKRRKPRDAAGSPGRVGVHCTVTVCRGGECGSRSKHSYTDHRAQLTRIQDQLATSAVVKVGKCLDACEHSNVIVVSPPPLGDKNGTEPLWVGTMNEEDDATTDLIAWVAAGGPGVSEV